MLMMELQATYQSPNASHTFSARPSSLPSGEEARDVKAKTAYLSALRSNLGQMQGEVNAFLTKKMEDEKAAEAAKANGKMTQEEKAEELYGEEDAEDDS
ncbi:hypothetical protein LTR37_002866 [Vermiconidia calcicola]|uniref:Uncharacterized protein n=1 Tax=Vermiconidia calcicola TaxID=1690605 RepID=A0ACC3NS74_9PEZI|nr:hypothetical protein LTR37_002866 [Vermiconidia calcicola]